jgi:hypothetical protein
MTQLRSERQDRSHWAKQRLSLLSQFCHEENQLHNTIANVSVGNHSPTRQDGAPTDATDQPLRQSQQVLHGSSAHGIRVGGAGMGISANLGLGAALGMSSLGAMDMHSGLSTARQHPVDIGMMPTSTNFRGSPSRNGLSSGLGELPMSYASDQGGQSEMFSAVGRRHQQIAAEQLRAELERPIA